IEQHKATRIQNLHLPHLDSFHFLAGFSAPHPLVYLASSCGPSNNLHPLV
ncbi:unnamed protein product, partial [Brassica rapa subsp. trilocularis]